MLLSPPRTAITRVAAAVGLAVSVLLASTPQPVNAVADRERTVTQSARASARASPAWSWPLEGPRMLVRPYVAPATPYSAGHRGIDIGVEHATASAEIPVFAPTAGVVHFVGWVVDRGVLSIRHPGGLVSSFEPVSSTLEIGEAVRAGQQVAVLQPGHCRSPCLHLGVRRHGEYLSPLNFLGGIPHSVLLPTRHPAGPPDGASDVVAQGGHQQ